MTKDLESAISLEDLIPILRLNHIYPSKVVNVKLKSQRVVGLHVDCPKILMIERQEYINNLLPPEFVCHRLPNEGYLLIEYKNKL